MVGWSDDGTLLVNEKPGGGEVSAAEAEAMRDAALKALPMAQEKVDATRRK
jgi:hypothetical protein